MSTQVLIRRPITADLTDVVRLLAQLSPMWRPEDPIDEVTDHHEQVWHSMLGDDRRIVLVAEGNHGVIGHADVVVVTSLLDGAVPHGVVDSLIVDAPYRREGVGRTLIDGVRRAAQDAGCCRLELLSSKELIRAHAFYQAVGFEAAAEGFRANLTARPERR
jgi:GNAT superfamily N-acetyltransferase